MGKKMNEQSQLITEAQLDQLLNTVQVPPPSPLLRQRILMKARKPMHQDIWQSFIQWLVGTTPSQHVWRPTMVLLLPLILGIIVGFYSASEMKVNHTQDIQVAVWLDQEVTLLGLSHNEFSGWKE